MKTIPKEVPIPNGEKPPVPTLEEKITGAKSQMDVSLANFHYWRGIWDCLVSLRDEGVTSSSGEIKPEVSPEDLVG